MHFAAAMKVLHWDEIDPDTGLPYVWNHPNLRWGSPSYVLEYGDYGYTPTGARLNDQLNQKLVMIHQRYYPNRILDQIAWLSNFRQKIASYAGALGLSSAQVLEIIADCRWMIYLLADFQPAAKAWGQAVTAALRQAQYGGGGTVVLPAFSAPPLPPAEPGNTPPLPAVVARAEGVLTRLFDMIAEIKENNGCTDSMCEDLGIVGSASGAPDLSTLVPKLTATRSGLQVLLGWGWGGNGDHLDALDIWVDRGSGFVRLVTDTVPNHVDTAPFPATQTIWKYKAIFQVDGVPVGQWSQEVSVVVGG